MTTGVADPRERLCVALDVSDRAGALRLVESLSGLIGAFKIGSQLFAAEGPQLVREIASLGERVFLDLKFHDIPSTVAEAVASATRLGAAILNVHALGGSDMMRAAARAAAQSQTRPLVLAVTVLTSMDRAALAEVGIQADIESQVMRLSLLARDAGLDGVISSPREIRLIRERVAKDRFFILTPGVRPAWSDPGDQKRIATPAQAIRDGADLIVIGRPIIASPDPRAAAERVLEEISAQL
jgi:orotidine-5'-phosphate decarboxylase